MLIDFFFSLLSLLGAEPEPSEPEFEANAGLIILPGG